MKKIIVAAIVCGLTIGFMLIGFNLYQQKQEEIRQEELRLEEEARLKAEAEEKARKEAEEKAKQEELKKQQETIEMAWKANYVMLVKQIADQYSAAVTQLVNAYCNDIWGTIFNQGGYTTTANLKTMINNNETMATNIKILEDMKKEFVVKMDKLANYPSDCYSAYSDIHSLIYWCEHVSDELTSNSFLYETEVNSVSVKLDLLESSTDALNDAADKVEVWANQYMEELDQWEGKP